LSFTNPDWLNNGSFYPAATMGAIDANGFEIYFTKNTTTFEVVGFAGDLFGTGDKQVYMNPADVSLQLPANFNDSYTTSSIQKVTVLGSDVGAPIDSAVQITYKTKTILIDAWGSLTTPYGTFDVLRINETAIAIDSTWAYSFGIPTLVDNNNNNTYNYTFFSNDAATKYPVMSMDHDNAGAVLKVDWLKTAPTVSVSDIETNEARVYPNPAKNQIIIEGTPDVSKIEIFTITGSLVLEATVSSLKTNVDISQLQNGTYLYSVLDNNGIVISSDKLVVKK